MKKNIDWLIVIPVDYLGGGAERLLLNLAEYLTKKGDKCYVIFLIKKRFGEWEHLEDKCIIEYSPFNNVFIGYLFLFPRLIKLAFTYKIKRTFTSQTLINAMFGFLKKMGVYKKTTIIVRESNSIFHLLQGLKLKRYTLAYYLGYSKVDLLICQTQFMKQQLLDAMPWMSKKLKIIVLPNPINLELISKKEQETLPELVNKKFLVAAGRLFPVKGFDLLIKSFSSLSEDFPELHLIILGEGPERENLQKMIDNLGLSKKIELPGFVNNVYSYFKAAELCVMSSRVEGFPNVLLQMMSQNTKVVSTLSAGGIEDLQGVFTCKTESSDLLIKTIKRCLQTNTSINRSLFDENLKHRTVTNFINNVLKEVEM